MEYPHSRLGGENSRIVADYTLEKKLTTQYNNNDTHNRRAEFDL